MLTSSSSTSHSGDVIHSAVALTAGGKHVELGKYRIISLLGQGGFGITYLAKNLENGQEVVIKENLPPDFAHRDSHTLAVMPINNDAQADFKWAMDNFLKEAGLLKQLNHPNIVKILDAFAALGTAYYVMPWVGGTELRRAAPAPAEITEAWLAPILCRLLDALHYLHGKNMLHRDIKPSNILMSDTGAPVFIDFGSARSIISEKSATKVGSPGYTPFEQVQSRGKHGPWSDFYALGATCYRLITGERPPRCEDRIGRTDCYHPLASRTDLHARFSPIFLASIDKALALWGEQRWQTATDWINILNTPQAQRKPITIPAASLPPLPAAEYPTPSPADRTGGSGKMFIILIIGLLFGCMWYGYTELIDKPKQAEAAAHAEAEARKKQEEQARAKAEEEAKAQALAEAKAAEQAEAARIKAEQDAKAQAEARARAMAEAEVLRYRRADVVQKLKDQGIYSWEYDAELRKAADQGNIERMKQLILAGADLNSKDYEGWSPLLNTAYYGHTQATILLLEKGADIGIKRNNGSTALHIAAQRGHTQTVVALINKGANLEAKTSKGSTPLHVAAYNGKTETVRELLAHGANRLAKDDYGSTPYNEAYNKGYTETAKLLR